MARQPLHKTLGRQLQRLQSNNYPELAKIGLGIHFNHNALSKTSLNKPLHPRYNLDTSVMSIDLFPGLNKHVLRHQLSTPGIKGVVLRTYGAGNGPTKSWFIDAVRDAISRGIIILNVTQCVNGAVHSNRYMGGDYLSTAGVVSGHDLTFEAAITKMMFLFGLGLGHDEVVRRPHRAYRRRTHPQPRKIDYMKALTTILLRTAAIAVIAGCALLALPPASAAAKAPGMGSGGSGRHRRNSQVPMTDDSAQTRLDVAVHNSYIYITVDRPMKIEVFTILGQLVTSKSVVPGTVRLSMGTRGIYIIKGARLDPQGQFMMKQIDIK